MEPLTLLAYFGVRAVASLVNQWLNNKSAEELRQIQSKAKKASQDNAIRRKHDRFVRECRLKLKLERISRQEQIESADKQFRDSLKKMARRNTLSPDYYPLRVSPYIIEKSVLPCCGTVEEEIRHDVEDGGELESSCLWAIEGTAKDEMRPEARQGVLCILTSSNEETFTNSILPDLDEAICLAIAQFWNKGSLHNICYYQGIWDNRKRYTYERIKNVRTVINSPTLTVTPYIQEQRLSFKTHFWRDEEEPQNMTVKTPILWDASHYAENKQTMLSAIYPILLCIIGQMVDVYYWGTHYQAPLLPRLLSKGAILLSDDKKNEIIAAYNVLYRSLALGQVAADLGGITADDKQRLEKNASMDMFYFPNRNIGFLKSCTNLMGTSETSDKLIELTMLALCEANTEQRCASIEEIDVSLLNYDVMEIVSELVGIANDSGNYAIAKRLTDLIVKKIYC